MTIRDYLLGKPDGCIFDITYIFEDFCKKCGKSLQEIDEEYSNSQTVGELRQDVADNNPESHYYGYDFVYNSFDIDSGSVDVEETAEKVSITITVQDSAGYAVCEDCQAEADAEIEAELDAALKG